MSEIKNEKSIKLALVVDDNNSYDESNVQVVDIVRIQPLNGTVYILETKPFNNICLKDGAGVKPFSENEIRFYLNSLYPTH